jgi:plasmid stabilization system protein ParE
VKQVVVRPAAAADIEDAFLWYERQREGLGNEFLDALRGAMDLVLVHPEAFPVLHRGTRRALVQKRFPYGLYFRVDGEIVLLVACMHAKRHPRRWRSRLDG